MHPRQIGDTSSPVDPNFTQRIATSSLVASDRIPGASLLAVWRA
jgi:hypothetical protein